MGVEGTVVELGLLAEVERTQGGLNLLWNRRRQVSKSGSLREGGSAEGAASPG